MSIMRTLKKIVDPIAARAEAAELRGQREQPQVNNHGKSVYQCRLCDYRSPNPEYCPECLAETMVEVKNTATK